MFDYKEFKRDTLAATKSIGRAVVAPQRIEWLGEDQLRSINAANFVTNEKWQYRLLADATRLVEISYGWMMDAPALGLTVYSKDPAEREGDHERSRCIFSINELTDALDELNTEASHADL